MRTTQLIRAEVHEVLEHSRILFFFNKGHKANILSFVGHVVSITISELCHCSEKAAIANMYIAEHDCVSRKLY